jgi:ParB family chromosome partitioning protein
VKKPADIRDTVLAGLDARRHGAPSEAAAVRQPAYIASFGRQVNDGLKDKIIRLETERAEGTIVLKLDPKRIAGSAYANRHERSLDVSDPELVGLIADIRLRGQLEPIRVRPAATGADFEYEIVYGHRRHAACLALDAETDGGFPVLALLDAKAADVRDHVLKMYQENAARKDLSAFETGSMFASWLAEGIFANQSELGAAVSLEQGTVAKYLAIARLPEYIVSAFGDPRVISLRWAESINAALKERRDAVEHLARELAGESPGRRPEEILSALVGMARAGRKGAAVRTETVKIRGRTLYKIAPRGNGMQITFGPQLDPKLAKAAQEEVKEALTKYLQKALKEDEQ